MNKETDPDFAKAADRQKDVETTYGNLGRHTTATSVEVSDANTFMNAIDRLHILSLPTIALLPRNLDTAPDINHLIYERESKDLQALAHQLRFILPPLTGSEVVTIHENDASIVLPGLYIALHEMIKNLDDLATLAEFFANISKHFGSRRAADGSEVKLSHEVIIGKHSTTKRLSYEGPASSLPHIVELIQFELENDDKP